MALLVNNAKFKNTEVTSPEVYVRLQYVALADGKKVSVALLSGLDKESVLSYNLISVNLPDSLLIELSEGQTQDLAVVHSLVKDELTKLGLNVVVSL